MTPTNPVLTYNGMTIKEMVDAINQVMQETGKPLKFDRGKDYGTDRYIWLGEPLRFSPSDDGLHDGASCFLGGDIEAIYQQVCDPDPKVCTYRDSDRNIYVRAATPEQWREHNARWERAMVDDPHRYGYSTINEALERTGYQSWDELQKVVYQLWQDGSVDSNHNTPSLAAVGSDGEKHLIIHNTYIDAICVGKDA